MALPVTATPPAPHAPALVVLEYFVAGHPLHIDLYLQQLGDPATTAGNPDFHYNSDGTFLFGLFESTSNEIGVQATVTAFLANIKPAYDPDVNFSIKSCWKRATEGGDLVEVFPTPALGAEAGTGSAGSSPAADDPGCFSQHIYTARGGNGGRFRFALVGAAPTTLAKPVAIAPDAAGTDEEKLVAYLKSVNCRILAHDGGKPSGSFVRHVGPSAKLRRSQNFA